MIPRETKVLICIGTGGVGKTTVAAALGAWAAEEGRKALVLTIDPSQRLKTTLELPESGEIRDLSHPRFKGSLSAAIINSKRTFDEFVLRAGGNSETAQKILRNKLYIQLSTTLSGSQEFTALEKLYVAVESGRYDLIILDTPPAKHALDFLSAPRRLSALFQDKITRWFRDQGSGERGILGRVLQVGTKQVIKALELLTGSDFMRELSDFFAGIQGWQSKLEERVGRVHSLLVAPDTHFWLVSSYDRAKLIEAQRLAEQVQKQGYNLKCLVLNRAFPQWWPEFEKQGPQSGPAGDYARRWAQANRERRERAAPVQKLRERGLDVMELPELTEDVRDLDGVFTMVDQMKEAR